MRIAVVGAASTSTADGIRDYTQNFVARLNEQPGVQAELTLRRCSALSTRFAPSDSRTSTPMRGADVIVVQYNPFWYGRRGFAPGLPIGLLGIRRRSPRSRIVLMVHETYVGAENYKWALMSAWQRVQLRAVQSTADIQLCSIERWTELLRRTAPKPVHHLPVPSNFCDRRSARKEARAQIGAEDDTLVLTTFGMKHAGRLTQHILTAARATNAAGHRVLLLNLGTGAESCERVNEGFRIFSPGFLGAEDAARTLSASDIFLGAYADGISTRRTTLMAALQHEIAVVGTTGHLTDSLFSKPLDAMRLAPVSEPDEFAEQVVAVASSAEERRRLGLNGRRLYEEEFDWPILIRTFLSAVSDHSC